MLIDRHGRKLDYLRLSVTDQCNLRCYYCMPEEGIDFARNKDLLSFGEMELLIALFSQLGIRKLRLTGGEPFVRKDLLRFIRRISTTGSLDEITLTTNGTLLSPHLPTLQELGIRKINLSLDSLDPQRFHQITRRDCFETIMNVLQQMLRSGFDVKLNCVVMAGKNTEDILPFIALTKDENLSVRFLEEMPFNGGDHDYVTTWNYLDIISHIEQMHPTVQQIESEPSSTSINYRIPGYKGSFGIIPSFSRTFCGTCNRLRLSATGELRTCLYGGPAANLRDLLRAGIPEAELIGVIRDAVAGRARDGFEAEAENAAVHHAMTMLGG